MKNTVKYWFGPLFHLFFPRCCAVCGASLIEGEDTICTRCNIDMPRTNYHKMKDNPVERMFWGKFPLERATSYFFYRKGSDFRRILHQLKYGGRKELGAVMGRCMAAELLPTGFFVEKGKIDVIRNDERIRLEPNKPVVLNKESGVFRVSAVNLDEKMDWRKGRMVFRNTPLEKVLKRLEKRYNVEIVLHKNSNAEYKYRATFTNETLEQILDYLKQTAPIEWSARQLSSHSDSTFVRQRIDVYQR